MKTTAFDLQLNPTNPGMQFHKLDRARDPNFGAIRVNRDIRLIICRSRPRRRCWNWPSAEAGKTIVALHRAVYLARSHPEARVLLTTFSDTLANALRSKLRRLISNEPRIAERLEVDAVGERLHEAHHGPPTITSHDRIQQLLEEVYDTERRSSFRVSG